MRLFTTFILLLFQLLGFAQHSTSAPSNLGDAVMQMSDKFGKGGGYKWKGTGTPADIIFKGTVVLPKSTAGTFCSGYTFCVAYNLLDSFGKLDTFKLPAIKKFKDDWYGMYSETAEKQCVNALERLKLGREIALDSLQKGDFIQLWRNNKSGHSAIFVQWLHNSLGDSIVGLRYKSTQTKTNGIGENSEYFGKNPKEMNRARVFGVRMDW